VEDEQGNKIVVPVRLYWLREYPPSVGFVTNRLSSFKVHAVAIIFLHCVSLLQAILNPSNSLRTTLSQKLTWVFLSWISYSFFLKKFINYKANYSKYKWAGGGGAVADPAACVVSMPPKYQHVVSSLGSEEWENCWGIKPMSWWKFQEPSQIFL